MGGARDVIHATAIAVSGFAALIRGNAGSGKSDLALRCLARGATPLLPETPMLVADDRVTLERREDKLFASPPDTLAGLLEVRGQGIYRLPFAPEAEVALIVDLVAGSNIERMPEPAAHTSLLNIRVAHINLYSFEPSADVKLLLALRPDRHLLDEE